MNKRPSFFEILKKLEKIKETIHPDLPSLQMFINVKTVESSSGKPARHETNTTPQWAGSCWYYLRFMDPKNSMQLVDKKKELQRYWSTGAMLLGLCWQMKKWWMV